MFTLFVNGTPVDDKTITVKPQGNVMVWMECNPELIDETVDSINCNIYVKSNDSNTIILWVTDVYFAGGKIYDWSNKQHTVIRLNQSTLEVKPGSSGTLAFSIPLNDELQGTIPVDLSDINPMTPIAVKVYLNLLKNPLISVIEMNPRPLTPKEIAKTVYSGAKEVKNEIVGTFTDAKSIVTLLSTYSGLSKIVGVSASTAGTIAGAAVLYIKLWQYVLNSPIPENTGDNNMIIGDSG